MKKFLFFFKNKEKQRSLACQRVVWKSGSFQIQELLMTLKQLEEIKRWHPSNHQRWIRYRRKKKELSSSFGFKKDFYFGTGNVDILKKKKKDMIVFLEVMFCLFVFNTVFLLYTFMDSTSHVSDFCVKELKSMSFFKLHF